MTDIKQPKGKKERRITRNRGSVYVYALVDPRDGRCFYVGKGSGDRAFHHEDAVRLGKISNKQKSLLIKEILDDGLSVEIRLLGEFAEDWQAFEFERELIYSNPGLTNISYR